MTVTAAQQTFNLECGACLTPPISGHFLEVFVQLRSSKIAKKCIGNT